MDLQGLQNEKNILTISSITDSKIRCEDDNEKKYIFEISQVPVNSKEGDVLIFINNRLEFSEKLTLQRKKEIDKMVEGLYK